MISQVTLSTRCVVITRVFFCSGLHLGDRVEQVRPLGVLSRRVHLHTVAMPPDLRQLSKSRIQAQATN